MNRQNSTFYDPSLLEMILNHHNTMGMELPPAQQHQQLVDPQQQEQREDDAQEAACFLLTLKHRSVTPEPHPSNDKMVEPRKPLALVGQAPFPVVGSVYGFPTPTGTAGLGATGTQPPSLLDPLQEPVITDGMLGDSKIILKKDRDLIPDSLYLAMSQMKRCELTPADRVGCYKTREIGFVGMCCKHCGGQPGFGRFFPNSVRSLAQTTTSQTIMKHVGSKCRMCPPEIRQTLLNLQRLEAAKKEGMAATGGRPRYGSRKIFFQRIWERLHGGDNTEDDDDDSVPKQVEETSLASASVAEDHSSTASFNQESDDDFSLDNGNHRRGRWETNGGRLPPMKKRKITHENRASTDRFRVIGV